MADDLAALLDLETPEAEAEPETGLDVTIEGAEPEPEDDEETLLKEPEAETEPTEETPLIKKLRQLVREKDRALKEATRAPEPKVEALPDLGEKPTLANCDFDEAKFEADLDAWKTRKAEHDQAAAKRATAEADAKKAWEARVADFDAKGARFDNFAAARAKVISIMTPQQQGMIMDAALDPSTVVAALGKNPAKAKALAEITNPVQFIAEIARLETKMKIEKRAPQTTPERIPAGTGASPATQSANLDKLKAKAQETGNYDAYFAAKRAATAKK